MSYNNYGGYSGGWPNAGDLNSTRSQQQPPIGSQEVADGVNEENPDLLGWSQHQYLPQTGDWSHQAFDPNPSTSTRRDNNHHQPHSMRYEPYQVHHANSQHHSHPSLLPNLQNPPPLSDFDLSHPSFLLPPEHSLQGWRTNPEPDRRDLNPTQDSASRNSSDLTAGGTSPSVLNQQPFASSLGLELPLSSTSTSGTEKPVDKKLVKKADKSCRKCRDRRVRCDRVYPVCDRCRKRRETCTYVDSVNVDEFEEGGDAQKVIELQSKVAALERQLKATSVSSPTTNVAHRPQTQPANERRSDPSLDSSSSNQSRSRRSGSGSDPSRTPPTPSEVGASAIFSGIGDIYANQLRFKHDEALHLISYLMGMGTSLTNLGHTNVNWRLGETEVTKQLTIHLMEAATHACCANIPGIKPLADRVDYYKRNIDKLEPSGQCAVAVLCALGARASPHSALLGVATTALHDGTPSPPLFLYAGERREIACRALERRAREVCWVNGMLESSNLSDLDAIIGVTQVLIFESDEEILPHRSRLFTRIAAGMYHDLRFKAVEKGERTSRDPRIGPGTALFLADAVIAASASRPSFISTSELETYYVTDGVPIPDFPGSNLLTELDKILKGSLTKEKLIDAITQGIIWVSGCARLFAQLTMSRRPNSPSPLPLLKNLWSLIDSVHNALQHLQSIFVHLEQTQVEDLEDSPYALDHFVLLGVRADSILVDLINLMHLWLKKDRNGEGIWTESEDDLLLKSMREESELRVRKCLKLSAFYAQLFLSSQDKHLVHHMMMQLEIQPDWTELAIQRVGTPGGPPSSEYEVTENELDWFQRALELSCYYTPKAANRLSRFAGLRRAEAQRPSAQLHAEPQVPPPSLDTVVPSQTVYDNPSFPDNLPFDQGQGQGQDQRGDEQLFPLGGGFVGSPSQLFIFDHYGIAAQQGYPAGTQDAVSSDATFQNAFNGGSWITPTDFNGEQGASMSVEDLLPSSANP
ncbi:hypothetical protein JCM3765_000900 [Sporobolomyces pararoseus]